MPIKPKWKDLSSTPAYDIFGDTWYVTRRVDSGHGFDLIYGVHELGGWEKHILDAPLERFILANLDRLGHQNLPISLQLMRRLRRIVSSRRYRNLADWEARRNPDEPIFWVHPDHIQLPKLQNIEGQVIEPRSVQYFQPVGHLWRGGSRYRYIMTSKLAGYLNETSHLSYTKMKSLGFPLPNIMCSKLRARALAYSYRTFEQTKQKTRRLEKGRIALHPDYIEGAEVIDASGTLFRIFSVRLSDDGTHVLMGRRAGAPPEAGIELILTDEIAALFDADVLRGSNERLAQKLGVSSVPVKRIRDRLEQENPDRASALWWAERLPDLLKESWSTLEAFAKRHGCSYTSIKSHWAGMTFILRQFEKDQKTGKTFVTDLASDMHEGTLAKKYDNQSEGTTRNHRRVLHRMKMSGLLTYVEDALELSPAAKQFLKRDYEQKAALNEDDLWWLDHLGELREQTAAEFGKRHGLTKLTVQRMRRAMEKVWRSIGDNNTDDAYFELLKSDAKAEAIVERVEGSWLNDVFSDRRALKLLSFARDEGRIDSADFVKPFFRESAIGVIAMMHQSDLWWVERFADLETLDNKDFSHKHDRTLGSVKNMKQSLRQVRECLLGGLHGHGYIADLESNTDGHKIAIRYNLSSGKIVTAHRKALRILNAASSQETPTTLT